MAVIERRRVTQGDTVRRRWRLEQRDGSPVPLGSASSVRMRAGLAPGQSAAGTTAIDAPCSIVGDPADGVVLEPVGGLGPLGAALYRVWFPVTYSDGTVETVPDEGWQLVEVIAAAGP